MNEFDQYIKHKLKVKYYIRYTDDFVIVHNDVKHLKSLIYKIQTFLNRRLDIGLHFNKVIIRKFSQGIDFLGYIILPHYTLLRTKTKKRMYRNMKQKIEEYKTCKIQKDALEQTFNSYLGVLIHANTYKLTEKFKNQYWFWLNE